MSRPNSDLRIWAEHIFPVRLVWTWVPFVFRGRARQNSVRGWAVPLSYTQSPRCPSHGPLWSPGPDRLILPPRWRPLSPGFRSSQNPAGWRWSAAPATPGCAKGSRCFHTPSAPWRSWIGSLSDLSQGREFVAGISVHFRKLTLDQKDTAWQNVAGKHITAWFLVYRAKSQVNNHVRNYLRMIRNSDWQT